jgi:excisionase family DNA binding protein
MQTGEVERGRARGNWNVSPLWEAKILLGVLKEQGLAGMGLVKAFERWAPTIARSSRNDMNRVYRKQTGREMSDYILVQLADKVVRHNQLPPQADIVRRALLNSSGLCGSEEERSERIARSGKLRDIESDPRISPKVHLQIGRKSVTAHRSPSGSSEVATGRANAAQISARNPTDANLNLAALKQRLLNNHDPNVLLSTNEVASLTGFRPKTIRRWVSHKLLNYIRVGNRLRFRLAALELFLGQHEICR